MHEYSIVQSLLDSCEDVARKNDAKKVSVVHIKIGVNSGVEPQLLRTAFDTFKIDTMFKNALLKIKLQKIKVFCSSCQKESLLKKFEYICPICKSNKIKVTDGEELYLMRVEIE